MRLGLGHPAVCHVQVEKGEKGLGQQEDWAVSVVSRVIWKFGDLGDWGRSGRRSVLNWGSRSHLPHWSIGWIMDHSPHSPS